MAKNIYFGCDENVNIFLVSMIMYNTIRIMVQENSAFNLMGKWLT